MNEIIRLTVAALARLLREGRLSARDVVEQYLARIAALDGAVSAFVTVLAERARAQAAERDEEARGGRLRGPLHGVPVAVKDLMMVAGVPMTAGSAVLGRAPSPQTATVVRRLEAAGAIVIGTTAMHEFAYGVTNVNQHSRTPHNPWDLERITGGSSGGSGAAVAARLAPAALGTDTGGSIRIPAALCGIVGLKPTFGRVSRRGVLALAASFDTVGPMTRSVEDAALLLGVIAGHDPADAHSSAAPPGRYADEMQDLPTRLRMGRLVGPQFENDLDPAEAAAVEDAARHLSAAGLVVRPVQLRHVEEGARAQLTVLQREAAVFHQATFPGRLAEYGSDVRAMLEIGAAITDAQLQEAAAAIARLKAEVAEVLSDHPVLFGPQLPVGAPRIVDADPRSERWQALRPLIARFTRLYNATGLPAISLPARLTSEGLPVAVQLAAGPFAEGLLLGVAGRLERAFGWSIPDLPGSS